MAKPPWAMAEKSSTSSRLGRASTPSARLRSRPSTQPPRQAESQPSKDPSRAAVMTHSIPSNRESRVAAASRAIRLRPI